jgi:hypothetical protein
MSGNQKYDDNILNTPKYRYISMQSDLHIYHISIILQA